MRFTTFYWVFGAQGANIDGGELLLLGAGERLDRDKLPALLYTWARWTCGSTVTADTVLRDVFNDILHCGTQSTGWPTPSNGPAGCGSGNYQVDLEGLMERNLR